MHKKEKNPQLLPQQLLIWMDSLFCLELLKCTIFLAQCKSMYVLYSSGKISVCSWTLSSASVQVSKLSQQFVFQSSLKVEPGYQHSCCLNFLHFSSLCLCTACSASQWNFFPYSRGKVSLAHFNLEEEITALWGAVGSQVAEAPLPFLELPITAWIQWTGADWLANTDAWFSPLFIHNAVTSSF